MKIAPLSIARAALVAGLVLGANQVQAACSFGSAGPASLQGSLNNLLGPGVFDAQASCLADGTDAHWSTPLIGGATILLELAGNAATNSFGIYDLANPANFRTIFSGGDTVGADAFLMINDLGGGSWSVSIFGTPNPGPLTLNSPQFGFFLGTQSYGSFYSETWRNGGDDHLFAYQGTPGTNFIGGPTPGNPFGPLSFILAWEDLPLSGGDGDYEDFLVQVVNILPTTTVPIPAAVWLLASGLLGLGVVSRKGGVSVTA